MTLREVLLKTLGQRGKRPLSRQRGVTLVEVLIVVAIMALIAGGVGFLVLPRYRESQVKTAQTQARAIRGVATQYIALKGAANECPTVEQLIAEKELDPENEKDPWGQVFTLACDTDDVQVTSPGPDTQEGTEDDIIVPEISGPAEG